jgi:hypothetical protein
VLQTGMLYFAMGMRVRLHARVSQTYLAHFHVVWNVSSMLDHLGHVELAFTLSGSSQARWTDSYTV